MSDPTPTSLDLDDPHGDGPCPEEHGDESTLSSADLLFVVALIAQVVLLAVLVVTR